MSDPFGEILDHRSQVAKAYAAASFNSTTWRMFGKHESEKIKKFLTRQIGDGRKLAGARNWPEYNENLARIVRRFQKQIEMNRNSKDKRPNFGQAAKVVNLYVKHLLMLPGYIMSRRRRRKLEKYAHVPLDRVVLKAVWGEDKPQGQFQQQLRKARIKRQPALSDLGECEYLRIQEMLAIAARRRRVPTIAYDYYYSWRGE